MTLNVARVTDNISHGGLIIDGSHDVIVNGLSVARLGDPVFCQIHGLQSISSASDNLEANGIPVARIGDSISCGAVITTGSEDTFND